MGMAEATHDAEQSDDGFGSPRTTSDALSNKARQRMISRLSQRDNTVDVSLV